MGALHRPTWGNAWSLGGKGAQITLNNGDELPVDAVRGFHLGWIWGYWFSPTPEETDDLTISLRTVMQR